MIIPKPRFFLILSAGFIISILCFFFEEYRFLQYLLYAGLLISVIIDFLSIPQKKEIVLKRMHEKYLSIGAENPIKIEAINNSNKKIKITIRDEYPKDFVVKEDTCTGELNPLSYAVLEYHVMPVKKGNYKFRRTYMRISGRLNLIDIQHKYRLATFADVYPNLIELKKYIALSAKNKQAQIGYKKGMPGGETEFDFLREYIPGDSYKKINWKATSRRRQPITEIDQKEYNRNIVTLIDNGRMMTTKYGFLTKLDYAIDTTLILAAAASQKKDYFGILSFSDKINSFIPLAKNNKIMTSILSTLYKTEPAFKKSNYRSVYAFLKKKIRKNSIIFIFSELYNKIVSKDLIELILLLSSKHQVKFVSFEESEKSPEGKNYIEITRDALLQEQIIEKETIIKDLQKKGIHTIRVNEENIKKKVVNAYLSA